MRLIKTYLLENGTFPTGFLGGSTVPNGKTVDVWATASSPKAFFKGSRPQPPYRESVNAYQLRSNGFAVRVNLYDIG
jgi:hypothetical protein